MPNNVVPPPGRPSRVPTQDSHAIPKEIFEGRRPNTLVEYFQTLPDWRSGKGDTHSRRGLFKSALPLLP
jgi:hypothetical protein